MKSKGFWRGPENKEDLLGEDVFKWKVKDEYLADGKVRGRKERRRRRQLGARETCVKAWNDTQRRNRKVSRGLKAIVESKGKNGVR